MKMTHPMNQIIVTLVLFLVIGIGYYRDLAPQYATFQKTRSQTIQLQADIKKIEQQTQQTTQYQTKFTAATLAFENATSTLPNANNFSDYLQKFVSLGESGQLKFATINPLPPEANDFYHEVPVQLSIIGTYQQLMDFMQQTLSTMLFNWGNWTITRETPAATTLADNSKDLLTLQTTAMFYYYP